VRNSASGGSLTAAIFCEGIVHNPGSPLVALVVDDEFLIAVELEAILTGAGYHVLSAVSVAEARNLVSLGSIDVAVLDFRMGAGALDFARELQALGVPLLFCTGSTLDEVHAVFPAVPVVAKPFSGSELLAGVAALRC
jgi:two-component system, response regulator PdtaR